MRADYTDEREFQSICPRNSSLLAYHQSVLYVPNLLNLILSVVQHFKYVVRFCKRKRSWLYLGWEITTISPESEQYRIEAA